MAQPQEWVRQADFQTLSPGDLGNGLEDDFDCSKTTQDEIRANLALIQRDDGELANQSVGTDQLRDSVITGVQSPTAWTTNTAFSVQDSVIVSDIWYIAEVAHTSGSDFAVDLAAGLWRILLDLGDSVEQGLKPLDTTSATSMTVGTGTQVFITQDDIAITSGTFLTVVDTANPTTNTMFGQVSSYVASTKTVTLEVTLVAGSGTIGAWNVGVSGAPGATGAAGADGSADIGLIIALGG